VSAREASVGYSEPFTGWLVLADPGGPIDLRRLFPDVEVRVETTSAGFADALSHAEVSLVVLMSPPAGPADLQRVAVWLTSHGETSAVLLSSHLAVAARLHALELGFGDAIDLASDPMEVVGRLSIAGRRGPFGHPSGERIALGEGLELDLPARAIRGPGRLTSLRPKELALLEFLAMHPGRAFTREELLHYVWHEDAGNERMVDVYVFWLRAKIERDPAIPARLVTVRGAGYRFDPPWPSTAEDADLSAPAPARPRRAPAVSPSGASAAPGER
jgi:DNA-binding response OmpR family regulator